MTSLTTSWSVGWLLGELCGLLRLKALEREGHHFGDRRALLGRPDEDVWAYVDRGYVNAMTSISTKTSLGRRDTSTVERAGGAAWKNRP